MREIDRLTSERYGVPSLVLMENAAVATVRVVSQLWTGDAADKRVLVLCGRGNNGGDGAAAARLLGSLGAHVQVVLFGRLADTKGDARTNFQAIRSLARDGEKRVSGEIEFFECNSGEDWQDLLSTRLFTSHDGLIDAMFGTGLTRPLEGTYKKAVEFVSRFRESRAAGNSPSGIVLSIDVPSGLNSDSAELIGPAVRADVTVTMTAPKPANVLPPASDHNGDLVVADIGSPADLIDAADPKLFVTEESDARRWLNQTRYTSDSYKNTHGHALVIAGSRGFTGAAALCGNAAMRAGAGLVTVATPASVQSLVATQVLPEVMTASLAETDRGAVSDEAINFVLAFAERVKVTAIGPGLSSEDERTRAFVRNVIERRKTAVVVDADGLNCLAPWPADLRGSAEYPLILTPHPGEMLRLLGRDDRTALKDRVRAARAFANEHQVILVLKGSRSLIAAPDGRVFVNPTGNPGLGTAGAGDTLTGIISGFLAQSYGTQGQNADAVLTVIAALYLSGLAGDIAAREIGMRAMLASDIREHLSAAICSVDPEGEIPQNRRVSKSRDQ